MSEAFVNQGYIVTGAASGIGLATARLLKARGARLALWDRDAVHLEQVATELDCYNLPVDVSRSEAVQRVMRASLDYLGGLRGVIHCAGVLNAGLFKDVALESHRRVVEVNLFGTLAVAYEALPHLRESRGSLIMMASVSAFYGVPEYASYSAAKAGVLGFAQSLRGELDGTGVHIGVVSPLFVESPMLTGYNGNTAMIRSRSLFFERLTPQAIAPYILAGIETRRFMIFPGWRPALLFRMSRYLSMLMHPLTMMTYRQGNR